MTTTQIDLAQAAYTAYARAAEYLDDAEHFNSEKERERAGRMLYAAEILAREAKP